MPLRARESFNRKDRNHSKRQTGVWTKPNILELACPPPASTAMFLDFPKPSVYSLCPESPWPSSRLMELDAWLWLYSKVSLLPKKITAYPGSPLLCPMESPPPLLPQTGLQCCMPASLSSWNWYLPLQPPHTSQCTFGFACFSKPHLFLILN